MLQELSGLHGYSSHSAVEFFLPAQAARPCPLLLGTPPSTLRWAACLSPGLPRHKAQDAVGPVVCQCDKAQEASGCKNAPFCVRSLLSLALTGGKCHSSCFYTVRRFISYFVLRTLCTVSQRRMRESRSEFFPSPKGLFRKTVPCSLSQNPDLTK